MMSLHLVGSVREAETGLGVPNLRVDAYDADLLFDDYLGSATTDADGRFEIEGDPADLRDLIEARPEVYVRVYAPDDDTPLYDTDDAVWRLPGGEEPIEVEIPRASLGEAAPPRRLSLLGDDDAEVRTLEAGESLSVEVLGVSPASTCEFVVSVDGDERFTSRLIADDAGRIEPTVLWPLVGTESEDGEAITLEEARDEWAGREIGVAVHVDGEPRHEGSCTLAESFDRPLVLPVDPDGRIRNGIEAGESDAVVQIANAPFDGTAHVSLVERRDDWRVGDGFEAVRLADGSPAVAAATVDDGAATVRVADADLLDPGAYDFVVRRVRYGYEDDIDPRLRESDLVTAARTGLVVREEFMASKAVLGSCVNTQPISGRTVDGSPYFRYADTFQVGEDVYGALDPSAVDPNLLGKMAAFYVIDHKSASEWSTDRSLDHLLELGGDANVVVRKTQSHCINGNKQLLWPSASRTGEFDVVVDFGNDATDEASFASDESFDPPIDMVDGYYLPGFRVVEDPATATSYPHAGCFEYDEGPVAVRDQYGAYRSVDLKARVCFPSDASGATDPSAISGRESDYPVVLVLHGNSSVALGPTSYRGYDYLLDHLARNGFIAASIYMDVGMYGHDRAELAFEHLEELQTRFGSTMRNAVGLLGHSRGGEAVTLAAEMNHDRSLGWNFEAIVSLAPTDQYTGQLGRLESAWATPYLVVYGSMDGDVAGEPTHNSLTPLPMETGFALYDRASDAAKSMVWVHGATHGRFNTVWGDIDLQLIDMADWPKAISPVAHRTILTGYATAFFRQHIGGEQLFRGVFTGEWTPAAVEAADGGAVDLFLQFEEPDGRVVDEFEGPHSATSWQSSTVGGTVSDANTLVGDPVEDELYDVDELSPHQTAGLELEWDGRGDELAFSLPAGDRDVSGYEVLSFRVAQPAGSSANPPGDQDLRVGLADGTGTVREVRVSAFGRVPEQFDRADVDYSRSALTTIRIPLSAYTITVPGPDAVDLSDVQSVSFSFDRRDYGRIHVDSLEFTD